MTKQSNPLMFADKYASLAKAVDVQPEEESIAKFFWYAGLRHAFQRGTSQAALLKPEPTVPAKEPINMRVDAWPGLTKAFRDSKFATPDPEALTPYEAKMLSLAMQNLLSSVQYQMRKFEAETNSLWKYCDKDKPDTKEVFNLMNKARTKIRTLKKQSKTLADAQRKLKKIAKGL